MVQCRFDDFGYITCFPIGWDGLGLTSVMPVPISMGNSWT